MKIRFSFFALLVILALGTAFAQTPVTGENPHCVIIDTRYNAINSVDNGRDYLSIGTQPPMIITFVSGDGSVTVTSTDYSTRDVYIYEYTKDLVFIRTVQVQNEYDKFGGFTKDNEGNYYLFSGKNVAENEKNVANMSLVKYDRSGNRLNTYRLNAYADNSYGGVRDPFHAGSCRMEISDNMLCVYFARQMFMTSDDGLNHQASYGFIVDKNTFQRVDIGQRANAGTGGSIRGMVMPYVSHSFNQFILPIDGGFVFVDQGDMYPRGFSFSKFLNGNQTLERKTAFAFKQGSTYQQTFAQLGGLVKTPDGYLFAGTYERNTTISSDHNDSRNVFVLTLDNELNNISEPIWITNYRDKNNENATSPKITALDTGRYLLLWELLGNNGYRSTYMTIIDKTGRLLTAVKEIPDVRLNINDILRYNRTNGNVYWAVDNHDKNIEVFSFNPDHPINVAVRTGAPVGGHGLVLESFTVDKVTVSQHELFTVQASIRNRRLDAFSGGQIGAALVDNNSDIVEVIGSTNLGAFNPGSMYSNRPVNCIVPNTVTPGSYRLRFVVRPTGGEWRIATITINDVPNAIPITVTAGEANGGGYGLGLLGLTASKTSVPRNEQFDVGYRFLNVGTDAFSGQAGAALVDNNNTIVAVLRSWNTGNFVVGARNSNPINITCTVPSTAAPGRYRLRMVVRPTGGEWRVATISVDNSPTSIDFTVR
jgi:hypothetical protein